MRKCPQCATEFPDEVVFCGHDGTITLEVQDPSDTDARIGRQLGDYLIVARIADGAMGRVFEGRHHKTKARVAIKVLHDHVASDTTAVERFKREAETARELAHPHVVQVIDFGVFPEVGSHFMTMEYLNGEELGGLIRRDGPVVPLARTLRILCQTATALEHAHSFGVIHRDLKPDNIFLCQTPAGDVVRLLDFGSVKLQIETGPKLTAFGTTLGSPYYMSPEQAMGKQDVDQRTDVYALGAILYEMLTGKIAFEGTSVGQILMKILNHTPDAPSTITQGLPSSLDDVVDKALRKEKTARYATALELAKGACEALGLSQDPRAIGEMPVGELEQLLANATPLAPKPFGVPSMPPPGATAPEATPATRGLQLDPEDTMPPPSGGGLPVVWIGVGAVVLLLLFGVGALMLLK